MNAEMDQIENNSQNPGICRRLLISVSAHRMPACKASGICSRLFNFTASAAPSLRAQKLLPRSWRGLIGHGLLFVQRIYDFIMQILVAQAIKPVTLCSFKDHSSIEMLDFQASRSEDWIGTTNDQTMQLAPHQDPSAEKDYQPMTDEKQAKEVDDSAGILTGSGSSCDFPGDEIEISQVENSIDDAYSSPSIVLEKGDEEKEQEKEPKPTVVQKARAPKKMVSINENVEIFSNSKKQRMMSKEWPSTIESGGEESKPLKSILKVGSKLTDINIE